MAFSRQLSPGVIGLLISAQPARSTRPRTAQRGLMRDKSELRERNAPANAGLLRRGQGESIPHLSPSPESAALWPSPAAREGARMITGIVRGLWGGVRGALPSGGGAARTVLACRAASHNEGVRNQRRPVPATALPRDDRGAGRGAAQARPGKRTGRWQRLVGRTTPRGTPEADHINTTKEVRLRRPARPSP